MICPSTQMLPSLSIHCVTFIDTVRTGHGASAEFAGLFADGLAAEVIQLDIRGATDALAQRSAAMGSANR
ncbi:hypothetical protein GCM10027088_19900 [Nocardia goodfellowii]